MTKVMRKVESTVAALRAVPLDSAINRSDFHCGTDSLDRYFQTQVTQDIRRRVTACFVALDDENQIAGYYTLASASVLLRDLPEIVVKKLPRYPTVPAVRMGRLAVAQSFKGKGLGAALLADALARSARAEIAAYALIVDALDEVAAKFYAHHGFAVFPENALALFLPLATVRNSFARQSSRFGHS